jgi:hypothetical protein
MAIIYAAVHNGRMETGLCHVCDGSEIKAGKYSTLFSAPRTNGSNTIVLKRYECAQQW